MKNLKLLFYCIIFTFSTGSFAKKVLFFTTNAKDANTVVESLTAELKKLKYDTEVEKYDKSDEYSSFKEKVNDEKPNLIITIDNKAVKWAKKYNEESKTKIPAIALMGLNLKKLLKGNKHIAGIAYETPIYSLATQFSNTLEKKVKEVVVFYRKSQFQERIDEAKEQLKIAQMKLKAINVEGDVGKTLETNLKKINKKNNVVWVILDSGILNKNLLTKVWLPIARENKASFITETAGLANPKMDFCVFATTPNLVQLANQATQMVRFILENGIKPHEIGVENLIAVDAYMNEKKAKKLNLKIKKDAKYSVIMLK